MCFQFSLERESVFGILGLCETLIGSKYKNILSFNWATAKNWGRLERVVWNFCFFTFGKPSGPHFSDYRVCVTCWGLAHGQQCCGGLSLEECQPASVFCTVIVATAAPVWASRVGKGGAPSRQEKPSPPDSHHGLAPWAGPPFHIKY